MARSADPAVPARIDTGATIVAGPACADAQLGIDPVRVAAVQQPGAWVAQEVDRRHPKRVRIAGTERSVFGRVGAQVLLFPLLGLGLVLGAGVMAWRGRR